MTEKGKPQRLSPTKETLNRLFALSGNICAFPGCNHEIFDEDFELVAQVCHIESALPEGERFNEDSNNEDRRKLENLMAMCLKHHVKTNNVTAYTTEKLREMKRAHEAQFTEKGRQKHIPQMAIDKVYEETKRLSEEILQTVKGSDAKLDQILAQNDQMRAYLTVNLPAAGSSPFKSEIDMIVSLRESFNQQQAIDLFKKFLAKNEAQLTPNEMYRTVANLGICYLEMNQDEEAADQFLKAVKYEPGLVKAMGLAALAYTIKSDVQNAELMISQALATDPDSPDAYQALIHTLSAKSEPFENILARIPEKVRENSEVAYSLGYVAREQGQLEEAVSWLQIALENTEGQKADLTAALANVMLETIDKQAFVLNGMVDQASKNKASLVIDYYNESWNAIAGTSMRKPRFWWLANRGIAKKFLGDRKGAYEDILAASEINEDFWTMQHLAIVALEHGQKEKMWEALERMARTAESEDEIRQTELFVAEMDVAEGRREQGIAALEALLANGLEERSADYVRNKLVELYSTGGNTEAATAMITRLVKDKPQAVKTFLTQSQYLIYNDRKEEALQSMATARGMITDMTPSAEIVELAELYRGFNEFKTVVELWEMVADLRVYSRITRHLLMAYYDAGENGKLIEACKNLLAAFGPLDMVTELLAWAYERLDDFESAIGVLTAYLEKYPDDQLIQARLAFIYYRQLDKESLKVLLAGIDHIDPTLPLGSQYKLARMFHYIGDYTNFFKFAYEVRRNAYEDPKAHDGFVSLSAETREEELRSMEPTVAAIGTVVSVTMNDTPLTYIIENAQQLFASRGEIAADSRIGAALIGKAVGDTFTLEQGGQPQVFRVVYVSDKFSHAFRESIQLLTTKFVAEAKTRKITVPQTEDGVLDIDAFLAPLKQDQQADNSIENIYKRGKVPIGLISASKKISPIRIWVHYMASADLGVFTTGPYDELVLAEKLIKENKPLVLDILTITTLSSLYALDDLLLLPNKKIVTHSTLEELYDLIHEQEGSSQTGSFTVGYADGQYVNQVLTPENVQAQIKHLQELAEWIKAKCTVVPVMAALELNAHEKQQLDEQLGKSFVDSMLTARDQDALLYSEEMPLRGFAYVNYHLQGCATFMLLRVLKDSALIDAERYQEKTLHLMAINYKFIPVDSDILYLAAKKAKFELAFPLTNALNGLTSALMLPGYPMFEAVRFFYKLYQEKDTVIITAENAGYREKLVNATLELLSQNFSPAKAVEEDLMRKIDRVFQYLPLQQQNVRALVRGYFAKS
jgi:tetratricopeptide (TPR) repeat protein